MRTIEVTADEERLIRDALQTLRGVEKRYVHYSGQTKMQTAKHRKTVKSCETLLHTKINY